MFRHILDPRRPNGRRIVLTSLCAITLLLAASATSAQVTPEDHGDDVLQPKHIARLRSALSQVVAPSGQSIAYTVAVPRTPLVDDDGPAWSELHVVDASGTSRPFVVGKVNVSDLQWMPDGSAMLYLAKRGDDTAPAIYRIPIDGGESVRLVAHQTDIGGFAVSADGKRLAFLATRELTKEAQEIRKKGFDQQVYEEDWLPTQVWLTDIAGEESPHALDLPGSASYVAWSPSGHELLVVLAPTPLIDDSYMFRRVHVVDVDAERVIQRIDNPGKLGQVGWSPDAKQIALVSAADLNDPHEGRLMVANAADGQFRDLMPNYQAHVTSFAWRNADTLVWVADEGTGTRLGTVTLAGQQSTLSDTAGPVLADLSLSRDGGTISVLGQSPTHSQEVFLLAPSANELKRLTHVNQWLDRMRLARQETIAWKARDGLELQGLLIYPLNYVEGRKYPLIMSVHGGPESHEPNGWLTSYSRPGQVAAARGFAVFYPNYRGSTGRGVEFSKLGQADAAGKEFDDLIDGIDHLVAKGLVDPKRVGITGGSYGGYASAWGATYYSDRFAASVMFVGISDNVSKLGTTDIAEEMYLVHHHKRLWEDWDYFLERSPIRHVQKNHTPTLILHGKNDPRVHPSQSLELHRHFKTLHQAPVRLVLYEGEGHGNRKAAARLDYHLRMLRWMEHYLQGPGGDPPPMELDYEKALQ
jgi:dipeptidyl aminopeptidase/acylaminoacyl peptidase